MAEYESIHGTRVKYLSSDPTLNTTTAGEVWYNSTSGTNKALVNIKAFSAGGNIPTRFYYGSGVGPATTTLGFGGVGPTPQPAHNLTIEYSGYVWTGGGNLNTARRAMYQFGTPTAAVGAGGDYSPASPTMSTATEEYNGSSWTNGNAITEQGSFGAAAGTLTAGLAFGGYNTAQTASSTRTVSYDGTNWTALPTPGSDTNTAGNFTRGGGGTQTAAIFSGGGPSRQLATEAWDGSSWTSLANMNLGRQGQGLLGTQTNALYAGGIQPSPSRTAVTEEWDGSAWATSSASLAAGRNGSIISQGGNTAAATIAGGSTGPAYPETTEEYSSSINALTSAAYASGGNLSNARAQFGSAKQGTQNAGLAFGGYVFGPNANITATEEYGGASWTSGGALPGGQRQMGGAGTQTAALGYGGLTGMPNTTVLEYNGSSWTAGGANPAGVTYAVNSGAGTQTAAIRAGSGNPGGATTTTQEYDGSSWTSANAMSVARTNGYFDGAQTAAIANAAESPSAPDASGSITKLTEQYDGTNWSSGTSGLFYLSSGGVSGGAAAQTAWMIAGGDGPNVTNNTGITQEYDGTAFASTAVLATPRRQLNGGGTQAAGLVFGGTEASSSSLTATEEYTGTTSTVTASTLTTS